jgi:predicted nicotinamide N-methyase
LAIQFFQLLRYGSQEAQPTMMTFNTQRNTTRTRWNWITASTALLLLNLNSFAVVAWSPASSTRPIITRLYGDVSEQETTRQRRTIRLASSGNKATLLSRTLPIVSSNEDRSITVWEWEYPAQVVESYWEAQRQNDVLVRDSRLLDPFGLVSWPGSVVAAQALQQHPEVVKDQSVLVLGAGVGVEAQAAALLGAKHVLATDIHPTTLQQLELGVQENDNIPDATVQTRIFDLFGNEAIPKSDLLLVADVLYNEPLASQVVRRLVEAWVQNPKICILVTDSQRFVDFTTELNAQLEQVQGPTSVQWNEQTLPKFTGSGVCIDEDQTYDVKVRTLWIGL